MQRSTARAFSCDWVSVNVPKKGPLTRTYRELIICELFPEAVLLECLACPTSFAGSPDPSCSVLLPKIGIQEFQPLGPDPALPRARRARAVRQRKLRQPAGPAARHPQPQAARPRSRCLAVEPAGAVEAARPQAAFVAAARPATIGTGADPGRSGGAARDRSVHVTHSRGSPAALAQGSRGHRAWRDHARRGRAPGTAGAYPAARDPTPRTN